MIFSSFQDQLIMSVQHNTSIALHHFQQVDHTSMTPVPSSWNPPMVITPPEDAIEFTLWLLLLSPTHWVSSFSVPPAADPQIWY